MSLSLRNIHVRYGQYHAVRGITLTAQAGQITAIVGPNGSGKSSVLGAVTGTLPFTGEVQLNGRDIRTAKAWQLAAERAVLPQSSRLAFPFSVLEVVRLGLQSGAEGDNSAVPMLALARVGLAHYAGRSFHDLSGGEAQRVMLARVLAQVWRPLSKDGTPRWLFLDEPVSALDIAHQLQVMRLAQAFAEAGGGVVAVMHDLNLTALFADQVAVMAQGICVDYGPTPTVLTDATLSHAYGCALQVSVAPPAGKPFILPHSAMN